MWGWRSEGGKQFGREPGPASSHHQQGVVEGETETTTEMKAPEKKRGEEGGRVREGGGRDKAKKEVGKQVEWRRGGKGG